MGSGKPSGTSDSRGARSERVESRGVRQLTFAGNPVDLLWISVGFHGFLDLSHQISDVPTKDVCKPHLGDVFHGDFLHGAFAELVKENKETLAKGYKRHLLSCPTFSCFISIKMPVCSFSQLTFGVFVGVRNKASSW